jgi:hypothetical protein
VSAVAELVVACLLVWLLFACFLFLAVSAGLPQRRAARSRARRRGGYIKQPVSRRGNQGTVRRVATYTGCLPAGPLPEAWAGPTTLPELNKRIGPGFSGSAMAGHPGQPATVAGSNH